MLTYKFPHLDPWGIGGFYEPLRTQEQQIPFEHLVHNLLRGHDGQFQRDPNFEYVCWNIIQKKAVNRNICFHTNASSQATIASEIKDIAPDLPELIEKWEINLHSPPSTKQEKKALKTLKKLWLIVKDLRGSSVYKQCRNEICAMIWQMGTSALFVTINLADIVDSLLRA
ncbi:hypothetical protein B0H10DRAFT_1788095 [Mycena sp. CBHHK59/15]|nr:hypothetical protein B0H10DRAFT_1788095 [Mycena sp. CBHHK59/15]